jgi:hypothetical protein
LGDAFTRRHLIAESGDTLAKRTARLLGALCFLDRMLRPEARTNQVKNLKAIGVFWSRRLASRRCRRD